MSGADSRLDPPPIMLAMGVREWSMLVFLSVIWGGSFFFTAVAVRELPPLTVAFGRLVIAASAFWLVWSASREPALRGGWRLWLLFIGVALFNNALPFVLIAWGQTRVASGVASILSGLSP